MTNKLKIDYIPLSKLSHWPRNPKLHASELEDSIDEFGFVEPAVIDERTGFLVAGHGRHTKLTEMYAAGKSPPKNVDIVDGEWAMPVVRGNHFATEAEAEKYILSSNALVIKGGWDLPALEEMLIDIHPYGIDLPEIEAIELDENESKEDEVDEEPKDFDHIPFELEGIFKLEEEVYFHPSNDKFVNDCIRYSSDTSVTFGENEYGIPNLRPDMLVEKLPEPLVTWGDRTNTPDDGKSWYLFNYGSVPEKDIPDERCIVSFFTNDDKINRWWMNPAYRTGMMLNRGITNMVVPDFSLWKHWPWALKLMSLYRAAWMGRYFQETNKIRIIPRLEFFDEDPDIRRISMTGVPRESPVLATQFHTSFDDADIPLHRASLEKAVNLFKPKQLLIYVSDRGRELVEGANLNCEVVMLDTAKKARKVEKYKETDPALLELRKRKRKDEFS